MPAHFENDVKGQEELAKKSQHENFDQILLEAIDEALSVDQAFDRIEKQSFGIVISDYELPQKNGLDFLKEPRQHDALKQSGYRVAKDKSSEEAEKLVQKTSVDMVFNEVKMPIMNGLEIYTALRQIKSDTKVVMTTNYREGIEDLIDQAISESAYTCIYKPFDVGKVVKLLEMILVGKTRTEIRQMEDKYGRKS